MTVPLQMTGQDRTYQPPRALRRAAAEIETPCDIDRRLAAGRCEAWDLFVLEQRTDSASWAGATLDSLLASIDSDAEQTLGCTDCADIGFYGVPDKDNPDLLTSLVRREGDSGYQVLTATGAWEPWTPTTDDTKLEVLDLELAGDLACALTSEAVGLLRRYSTPRMFLPPAAVVAAVSSTGLISAPPADTPRGEWVNFAVVDEFDPGAVLELIRVRWPEAEQELPELEFHDGSSWQPDEALRLEDGLPVTALTADMAAMVADAPLTVSPDPRAEKLRRYWSTGKGAAKLRWNTPGDWVRCYRHLRKYMGLRAKGYCQNLHKRNDGVWTGDRRNPGGNGRRSLRASAEESLYASILSGHWTGNQEGIPTVTETATAPDLDAPVEFKDGIYSEVDQANAGIMQTLVAGGFPVAPPKDWFSNPKLDRPTPITITDEGRIYGHIAPSNIAHIGLPGNRRAPRSATGYAYFMTGSIKTAEGDTVPCGQLTVAGGHASTAAGVSAQDAVKHYDDTGSAGADVAVGDDEHGIWCAGSLRPDVTPDRVRVMRASPLSGDWRSIGGHLELVAACHVNVPGFPIPQVCVASGAIVSMVAAGVPEMVEIRRHQDVFTEFADRMKTLEDQFAAFAAASAPPAEAPAETITEELEQINPEQQQPGAVPETVTTPDTAEGVQEAPQEEAAAAASTADDLRAKAMELRKAGFRAQVAAAPPWLKGKAPGKPVERPGGGFPIGGVAALKKAILAYGRSRPEDRAKTRAHIISMAKKLGRTDLIPANWK